MEEAGWSDPGVSGTYETYFTSLTSQSTGPLLDAVGAGPGVRLLDVACGPGQLSAEAAKRGGDAEELPFDTGSFDAVVMCYGLLHLSRPDLAIREAFRVLSPGGRFAFTVWAPPNVARGFGLILDAVQSVGDPNVPLPPGPPFFRFSDHVESERTLKAAGFVEVSVVNLPQRWSLPNPEALLRVFEDGTVRTRALLRGQTPEALEAIRAAVRQSARQFATGGALEIPMPAVLASGRKP
jgi:SAM-dependent methyltransferase